MIYTTLHVQLYRVHYVYSYTHHITREQSYIPQYIGPNMYMCIHCNTLVKKKTRVKIFRVVLYGTTLVYGS